MSVFNIIGDWSKTFNFFNRASRLETIDHVLQSYAQKGVSALSAATPKETGETASSWGYSIEKSHGKTTITWTNSNINEGVNVAVILQYGHGTRNGGYVEGIDYINPALKPVFQEMADAMWKELIQE